VGYPRPVDLGLVVDRIGTSSVTYRIGIFQEGVADTSGQPRNQPGENQPGENQQGEQAAAEGRFVHVYVDNTAPPGAAGRSTRPVPDEIRAVLEPLLRR
jgi:acyl-CoA thioester hydrolase